MLGIPEGLELDVAAPLLCAGITLYSPLRHWGAVRARRSRSSGWAGSGTWASRSPTRWVPRSPCSARAWPSATTGCAWAPTTTYATSDPATFTELAGTFDLIVNTVSATIDVDAYLSLLALDGAW